MANSAQTAPADVKTPKAVGLPLLSLASVILLDAMSYSLVLPLLPFILKTHQAGAVVGGALIATHALFATLAAPLQGALSDRIGRKPIILASVIGTAVSYILFGLSHGLVLLFLSRALSGAMAGNSGVIHAAAADQSTTSARAKVMGVLSAAVAMGFVLGPAVSALIGPRGDDAALWVGLTAATASMLALALVGFGFKDRVPAREEDAPSAAPVTGRLLFDGWTLQLLALVAVAAMSHAGLVSMTSFWANYAFGWTAREVGFLFCWVSVFMVVAQIGVVPRLAKTAGEAASLRIGLTLCVVSLVSLIVAPRSALILAIGGPVLFCGITLVQTMCMSLLSKQVPAAERGALMGWANGAASSGRIFGPALCGVLFAHVRPVAPYWLVAAMMGAWLAWLSLNGRTRKTLDAAVRAMGGGVNRAAD